MKQILNILFILSILSCKAQSLIKSLDGDGPCPAYDANCYEKDVNDEFEKFTGTWKYQNGATEITFKLKKELHYQISPQYRTIASFGNQHIKNDFVSLFMVLN